ncbi:VC0807 family protein [Amycolatopsis thermophila]|uniref:Intracellular septation protein A n=1 Tax=Amycolatopsis thermophila TaxID=206084 RepID=A0ABU0EM28_9PSEU|nr:VC0807 family protein [Amycolatopsis thermophila]MDQ0376333.1 hypothetical protein [Amycolatopsis thermophila]
MTAPAGLFRTLVLDIGAPLALFYGLRGAGTGDTTALLVSAVPPAVTVVVTAWRARRADALAVAVVAGTVLGAVAALLGGGPRELLARGAWFTAPAGLWTLATLLRRQPLTYEVTRTFLVHRATIMDRLWDTDRSFRAAWRSITICWGVAALADSALRLVMAYTLPVAVVPALDTALTIVTIVVLQLPTHLLLRRSGHWHSLFGPSA